MRDVLGDHRLAQAAAGDQEALVVACTKSSVNSSAIAR